MNGTFGGVFANEVVCCKCGNSSLKSEPFFDLEVDVVVHSVARRRSAPPESVDLEGRICVLIVSILPFFLLDCLRSFCKWESIPDYKLRNICFVACFFLNGATKDARNVLLKLEPRSASRFRK